MSSTLNVYNKQQFNADVSFNGITTFNNAVEVKVSGSTSGVKIVSSSVSGYGGGLELQSTGGRFASYVDASDGHYVPIYDVSNSRVILEIGANSTSSYFRGDINAYGDVSIMNSKRLVVNSGSSIACVGAATFSGAMTISGLTDSGSGTGKQLYIDTNGVITKGNTNTGPTGATGAKGDTGATGATGAAGSYRGLVSHASESWLGIGISPSYPLHVNTITNSSNYKYTGSYYFNRNFINNINHLTWNSATFQNEWLGLYVTNGGYFYGSVTATGFAIESDSRIKTNIVDIDDSKALSILRQIQPKTYEYVDKIKRGEDSVIGFIAQEIKSIIPKAVTIMKNYIPNFYTLCQVSSTDVPNIVLVTSPIDLSWNPLHDNQSGNAFVDAAGNACSDASGNKVFNIRLYDQSNNEIKCKTTDVLDKRSFLMDISGSNVTNVMQCDYFLHGQEVDDFHTIDKSAIFTVVTAAVQDIDRIVQAQSATQQADAAKIAALEEQVSTLQSQLQLQNAAFETRLAALESK